MQESVIVPCTIIIIPCASTKLVHVVAVVNVLIAYRLDYMYMLYNIIQLVASITKAITFDLHVVDKH